MEICLNVLFYSKYICYDRSYIKYMSHLLGQAASMARPSDTAGYYKDYLLTFEVYASAYFSFGFILGFFFHPFF